MLLSGILVPPVSDPSRCLCEELSGVYPGGKKTIEAIYRAAVGEQPYSFLFCNLMAKEPENTFWLRFEKRLVPHEVSD